MAKIKLGIVGIGKIARDQHLPVLAQSDDFELIAVASRNASVEGVRTYLNLEAMLAAEPSIEALSLCTPPGPREADARIALARGLHLLLEKPPAATLGAARDLAGRANGGVLCASWHSRHAPGVEQARMWLSTRRLQRAEIVWKEDIRRWHPGQDWILDAGGMGVFDPGINALSILTTLVPEHIMLTHAELGVPRDRQAPLTAALTCETGTGATIVASFDFLQTGEQIWSIELHTDNGRAVLSEGGARFELDGQAQTMPADPHFEYKGVYRHFARCVRAVTSDFDIRPLEIVADAFLIGQRRQLADFQF